jgi:hypothetical protein
LTRDPRARTAAASRSTSKRASGRRVKLNDKDGGRAGRIVLQDLLVDGVEDKLILLDRLRRERQRRPAIEHDELDLANME